MRANPAVSAQVSRQLDEGVRAAFAEDQLILNAVGRGFASGARPRVSLPGLRTGIIYAAARIEEQVARQEPAPAGSTPAAVLR